MDVPEESDTYRAGFHRVTDFQCFDICVQSRNLACVQLRLIALCLHAVRMSLARAQVSGETIEAGPRVRPAKMDGFFFMQRGKNMHESEDPKALDHHSAVVCCRSALQNQPQCVQSLRGADVCNILQGRWENAHRLCLREAPCGA